MARSPRLPNRDDTVDIAKAKLTTRRIEKQRPLTPMRIARFIEAVRTGSEFPEAAEYAGADVTKFRALRRENAEFAKLVTEAEEQSVALLITEARRRAVEGWEEPIFHRGAQVGARRLYSDRMLELLLKARAPEFADKRELTVTGNVVLTAAEIATARGLPQLVPVETLELIAMSFVQESERVPAELESGVDP